ncbi:Uncharacterized protein TCAP_06028 [Tolypocladium capitatum]|uniref:Sodium/calcium exchanger membrane region domain-containing protein n=1 Tax=Tolypocladium capitatum TaxID=45235 RepID=A0A2K3Q905_9HYPO|nr:Uncharacterized protein TCAP_06028 [Tolypocladium capitatum]
MQHLGHILPRPAVLREGKDNRIRQELTHLLSCAPRFDDLGNSNRLFTDERHLVGLWPLLMATFGVYMLLVGLAIGREDSDDSDDGDDDDGSSAESTTGLLAGHTSTDARQSHQRRGHTLRYHGIYLLSGFLVICLAGYVLAQSAIHITDQFGISDVLFGVVILAVATTLPEKFVAVMSGHRGYPGILVANCVGSNIFLLSLCCGVIMSDTRATNVCSAISNNILTTHVPYDPFLRTVGRMSDLETTATVSVDDIAAFSDAQLAQFMQKHRRQDGNFDLPVDDWDRLSKMERKQLAERLQAQLQILSLDPAVDSRPLDLDQLDQRLRQVSDGDDIVSRTQQRMRGRVTPPYDEEDELRDQKAEETEAYNNLVSDGGRPIYPIGLIEQVSRKPEVCREQIDNRGLEERTAAFLHLLAKIEADPSWLKSEWLDDQRIRRWQRRNQRERGCNGFSDYVDAMKRRLAQHGFTRSFQLQENPKHSVERLEPDHDKRWQELVEQKIPKPQDTKESIRTTPSSMQRHQEEDRVREAKQAAEAEAKRVYSLTQEDPRRLSIPKEKRLRMLQVVTRKVVSAQERRESIRRRNDRVTAFIRGTFDYVNAKKDAAGHAVLAQWVIEQVPIIEAELIHPEMTEAGPDTESKTKKRAQDEGKSETRSPKKRKPNHRELSRLSRSSGTVLADLGEASQSATLTIPNKNRDEGPRGRWRQAESGQTA